MRLRDRDIPESKERSDCSSTYDAGIAHNLRPSASGGNPFSFVPTSTIVKKATCLDAPIIGRSYCFAHLRLTCRNEGFCVYSRNFTMT
ncbi:hypothetical protein ABKN59_007372 [Abortiporus biennis]